MLDKIIVNSQRCNLCRIALAIQILRHSLANATSQDAILSQSTDKKCIGAFVASKDAHDYGITTTESGSRIIRIPAPTLCYLLGAS